MSKRHFSALLIAVLAAAAAIALLLPSRGGREASPNGGPVLEGLAERVNKVDRLVFTGGGGSPVSTLERDETVWRIAELGGYPADWGKLREFLAGLARAEVVEAKTANPEYYDRLGVEDPRQEGAQGILIEIFREGQGTALIAGNDATGRDGQYLRIADRAQSVLADRSLDATAEPIEWADTAVLDIGSALVAELEILHPDGERVSISKVSADDGDFTLAGVPEEREAASTWTVNSLANVFSLLRMDGVAPDDGSPAPDPVRIRALTFDGLEVNAEAFERDGEYWIRVGADAPEPATEEGASEPGVGGEPSTADAINRRTAGWLYRVPELKFRAMTRRMEDLLKSTADDGGT